MEGSEPGDEEGWEGGDDNEDKERDKGIRQTRAESFGQEFVDVTARHAGEHHAEPHERGAEGVVLPEISCSIWPRGPKPKNVFSRGATVPVKKYYFSFRSTGYSVLTRISFVSIRTCCP